MKDNEFSCSLPSSSSLVGVRHSRRVNELPVDCSIWPEAPKSKEIHGVVPHMIYKFER